MYTQDPSTAWGYHLSNTITVSAKIPNKLMEKLHKLKINVSRVIREALEKEIRRKEEEQLRKMAEQASLSLKKILTEEIVRDIRESREER